MKKINRLFLLTVFFSVFLPQATYAALVNESCTTGIYASDYALTPSCSSCGYISRFYINTVFDTWDWYHNLDGAEKMISGSSFWNIVALNGSNLTVGQQPFLTSNTFPAGVGTNGRNEALVFVGKNLRFSTPVATRATPIGQVEYTVRSANVIPNGNFSATVPWSYNLGSEVIDINGITNMNANLINLGVSTKSIDTANVIAHKQCYVFLGAWCGDGVLDAGNEACDFADTTQAWWGVNGCNASCQAIPGGGGGVSCVPWTTVWIQASPITVATAGLCPIGQAVGGFTSVAVGLTTNYTWSCNGSPVGGACAASYTSGGGGGWGGGGGACWNGVLQIWEQCDDGNTTNGDGCSAICTIEWWGGGGIPLPSGWPLTIPGSSSYCGNGAVERPNASGQYENCDTTAAWCVSCNIASTNPGSILPGQLTITTPGSSSIGINSYKLIIWNQVPVFSVGDIVAFETNNPMYLNGIPATITNHSSLLGGTTVSKTINNVGVGGIIRFKTSETPEVRDGSGNIIVPWTITYREDNFPPSTILFQWSELQAFEGNTNNISGSYEDTVTANPTYRSQGFYASIQYLESPFDIRVSKPIISNTAGWNAFIGSALGNSVDIVVQTFFNNLRSGNFTTSTVNVASSYALSSATNSVSNDGVLSQAITSGSTAEIGSITQSSLNTSGIYTVTSIASDLEINSKSTPLSDAVNIRVFKDGDVSIDETLGLTGVKTVIVENGNLIINNNIRYADSVSSFAWIVKNGNIIIADTVQEVAGVYVTLAGSIVSNGVSTPNRLIVDGSLYGNTSDLVNNRSYVRGQVGYTALNVGVVVNYSNRAIMYPPPFLARFLEQYSLQRVAR